VHMVMFHQMRSVLPLVVQRLRQDLLYGPRLRWLYFVMIQVASILANRFASLEIFVNTLIMDLKEDQMR
jgi:hypothetical protein